MEKINAVILALFLIIGTFSLVFAEENNGTAIVTTSLESGNDTTDDKVVDDIKFEEEIEVPEAKRTGFFRRINFAFIFNKEKKIERALEIAEEKLAYADSIAEENPEKAEKIYAEYEKYIQRAEKVLDKIESKSNDEEKSSEEISKLVRIQERFEKHQEKTDAIYNRALERFEANNVSPEKMERFENFYARATEKNKEALSKAVQRQENALKKHKVLTEMSDGELEDLLGEIEEREGVREDREDREGREEKRFKEMRKIKEISIERILKNPNLNENERQKIKEAFEIIKREQRRFKENRRVRDDFEDDDFEDKDDDDFEDGYSDKFENKLEKRKELIKKSNMTREEKKIALEKLEKLEDELENRKDLMEDKFEKRKELIKDTIKNELDKRDSKGDDLDNDSK